VHPFPATAALVIFARPVVGIFSIERVQRSAHDPSENGQHLEPTCAPVFNGVVLTVIF
jgi:hypothetical protein